MKLSDAVQNPDLKSGVQKSNYLKGVLVEHTEKLLKLKSENVTLELIIEALAKEFPELVLAMAEENFLRGYEQALVDVESEETNSKKKKRR